MVKGEPRSARTARDNARARAAGYRDYYDYRVHDYGRRPPSAPRAHGAELERLRGHRSAADLERLVAAGRVELLMANVARRDADGKVRELEVLVTLSDGSTRAFVLRGKAVTPASLRHLQQTIGDASDTMLTIGSPGARKLVDDEEPDELEQQLEADIEIEDLPFGDEDIPF